MGKLIEFMKGLDWTIIAYVIIVTIVVLTAVTLWAWIMKSFGILVVK